MDYLGDVVNFCSTLKEKQVFGSAYLDCWVMVWLEMILLRYQHCFATCMMVYEVEVPHKM